MGTPDSKSDSTDGNVGEINPTPRDTQPTMGSSDGPTVATSDGAAESSDVEVASRTEDICDARESASTPDPIPTVTIPNREAMERDTILVLGRRAAGKTVFLSTLYARLYTGHSGMTMKALRGPDHLELTKVRQQLVDGEWPAATNLTRSMGFELIYENEKRLMIALDYSGEDFRRAFIEERTDAAEIQNLLNYIDRAAAVVLLLDPAVVLTGGNDERVDDDFGMIQAVERIRNWGGGEKVPIVLAFTKSDRHLASFKAAGGVREFAILHYPALMRTLGDIPIVPVSAAQQRSHGGVTRPSPNSKPKNVEAPILFCLRKLKEVERRTEDERARRELEETIFAEQQAAVRSERRRHIKFWVMFWLIMLLAVAAAVAVPLLINKYRA